MFLSNITDSGGVPLSVNFDSPVDYLVFIFQLLFATAAVLVAGPIVVTIFSTRALRLQNRFIFMLNTSICDTLVGFSVFYLGLFDVQEGYPSRNGTYNMLPSLLGVNIMTFLFAQFDRYLAVCHPFIYSRFITRGVVISANVFCWLHVYCQTIILLFLPLAKAMQLYAFGIISLQIIVLTKVVMTIKLYVVARFQLERDPPSAERENNKESLRIIIFVVISFLVLWGPSFVNIIIRYLLGRGLTFRNEATNLFAIMARFNAVCTPAVYLWGSPALREAMLRTVWGRLCPRCKKNRLNGRMLR
ncbi:G-protein coupled receptor 183-like [Plectropomus leopardus]|uniref:G-protein coupled receptor 183-like n=1 Tax=Plectropomus leopardus TaxID=160734 RepID=UPI001C4BEC5A|nr:G-protein coupled receptor 183-like [Plectropomus leopardus]